MSSKQHCLISIQHCPMLYHKELLNQYKDDLCHLLVFTSLLPMKKNDNQVFKTVLFSQSILSCSLTIQVFLYEGWRRHVYSAFHIWHLNAPHKVFRSLCNRNFLKLIYSLNTYISITYCIFVLVNSKMSQKRTKKKTTTEMSCPRQNFINKTILSPKQKSVIEGQINLQKALGNISAFKILK